MTTAAMALSSSPVAKSALAELRREVSMIAATPAADPHEGVDRDLVAVDLHAGKAGGRFVAADGVDVETEPGVAQDEETDQKRDRTR